MPDPGGHCAGQTKIQKSPTDVPNQGEFLGPGKRSVFNERTLLQVSLYMWSNKDELHLYSCVYNLYMRMYSQHIHICTYYVFTYAWVVYRVSMHIIRMYIYTHIHMYVYVYGKYMYLHT